MIVLNNNKLKKYIRGKGIKFWHAKNLMRKEKNRLELWQLSHNYNKNLTLNQKEVII